MSWRVELLDGRVEKELNSLSAPLRAAFEQLVRTIQEFGISDLGLTYSKHIVDKIWELRLRAEDGIARALYVTVKGERLVVIYVFTKKTQRTPKNVIDTAKKRAKEVK